MGVRTLTDYGLEVTVKCSIGCRGCVVKAESGLIEIHAILKNLYKTLIWLVGPIKLIWFDSVAQKELLYQFY